MLEFVVGGIYTLTVMAIAFTVGLFIGAKAEPELYNDLKRSLKKKVRLGSGPIKPLTKAERQAEEAKYIPEFIQKL